VNFGPKLVDLSVTNIEASNIQLGELQTTSLQAQQHSHSI